MRIGHGFDAHRFGEGDHIMLGGVSIPFDQGFIAHSDGDVVIHALCDALLGAAALGTSGFVIDRTSLAELLGFNGVVENSYDAFGRLEMKRNGAGEIPTG